MRRLLLVLLATLACTGSASAHEVGSHVGFVSTVSVIEPPQPGLIVQVLGGHERLSVANFTGKQVVVLDAQEQPLVEIAPGETELWDEPRIGPTGPPPETEGLVRNWRIAATADGEPFEIVGFLGYRPPAEAARESSRTSTWTLVAAGAAGLLAVAAALTVVLLRREGAESRE